MDQAENDQAGSWVVYRQDDNGNRFVVRAGLDRHEAVRSAAELERTGIRRFTGSSPSVASSDISRVRVVGAPTQRCCGGRTTGRRSRIPVRGRDNV